MKKLGIAIGIIIILTALYAVIAVTSGVNLIVAPRTALTGQSETMARTQDAVSNIHIAIAGDSQNPSQAAALLKQRLEDIGFKANIIGYEDPRAQENRLTTILTKKDDARIRSALEQYVLSTMVYRTGVNPNIAEDALIVFWNIDDIKWGDILADAQKLLNPDPAAVSLVVVNAGSKTGEGGKIADTLKGAGYSQAQAETADFAWSNPAVVYYQRNHNGVAKKIVSLMRDSGYADVTYRARFNQAANIIVVIGSEEVSAEEAALPAE